MKLSIILILGSLFLLAGCSLLLPQKGTRPPFVLPQNPLEFALNLSAQKRYTEALQLLREARYQGYGDQTYASTLSDIHGKQVLFKQRITDQYLVEQTHYFITQLPNLRQITLENPNDSAKASELQQLQRQLQENKTQLARCGRLHFYEDPELAKDCLSLALSLENNSQNQLLLNYLIAHEEKEEWVKGIKLRMKRERQASAKRKQYIQDRFNQAKKLYQQNQLNDARRELNRLIEADPDNAQLVGLLEEVESRLDSYVDYLLKAGDRLYRNDNVEGAKLLWQAAENIDPSDSRLQDRLQRATKVLENMQDLRQQQSRKGVKTQ